MLEIEVGIDDFVPILLATLLVVFDLEMGFGDIKDVSSLPVKIEFKLELPFDGEIFVGDIDGDFFNCEIFVLGFIKLDNIVFFDGEFFNVPIKFELLVSLDEKFELETDGTKFLSDKFDEDFDGEI